MGLRGFYKEMLPGWNCNKYEKIIIDNIFYVCVIIDLYSAVYRVRCFNSK